MLTLTDIAALHDQLTSRWHQEAIETWQPPTGQHAGQHAAWIALVARQHLANFELWHTEDEARTPGATDSDLARVKRRIDETNQRRNDLSEQIDEALLDADLHSRACLYAGGSAALRVSGADRSTGCRSLALKLFHTREGLQRRSAPAGHAGNATARGSAVSLEPARATWLPCLARLWAETLAGQPPLQALPAVEDV